MAKKSGFNRETADAPVLGFWSSVRCGLLGQHTTDRNIMANGVRSRANHRLVSGKLSDLPDLAEFELPNEFIPDVLKVFTPPVYYSHPLSKSVDDVGLLRIECRDGRLIKLQLLFSGKGPLLFILEGVPCIRGGPYNDLSPGKDKYLPELLTIEGYLRAIQRGNHAEAKELLKLLDRSVGQFRRTGW